MQVDVLTIGNALIDAFLTIHDASEQIHFDREKKEFRIGAGDKVQLDSCIFEIGGNACNVAVGLSRLGLHAGCMAEIGKDEFSEKIIRRLEDENVETEAIQQKGQSSFAMGINFRGERTLFVQHFERAHDFSLQGISTHCIYLTSMGNKWHHVYQNVRNIVKKDNIFLALNPGTRQLHEGAAFIRELLPYVDVLFINKEEGYRLIGRESGKQDMKYLLETLADFGVETVVVTDGNKGSFARDTFGKMYQAPIFDAPIVERTGAGDGFATGFLGALLSGRGTTEAMRWGSFNAAGVIGKIGAQPGLLTIEAMEKLLDDDTQVQVKEF